MSIPTTTENTWLHFSLFQQGAEPGFNFFYALYYKALLRYGQRYTGDYYALQELVNDAFLYTWSQRTLVTTPRHLYCFTRLRLKWACCRYLKQQRLAQHHYTEAMNAWPAQGPAETDSPPTEELLQLVYKALPLLPPTRQTVLRLYFHYGLSYRQIAGRYRLQHQAIYRQVQESIAFLQAVVRKKKTTGAPVRFVPPVPATVNNPPALVLQLRQLQHSFDHIAAALQLPVATVKQYYVQARRQG